MRVSVDHNAALRTGKLRHLNTSKYNQANLPLVCLMVSQNKKAPGRRMVAWSLAEAVSVILAIHCVSLGVKFSRFSSERPLTLVSRHSKAYHPIATFMVCLSVCQRSPKNSLLLRSSA